MLFLLFQLGENRYALDSARIAEILPLVGIKPISQTPAGVTGVFNYRGVPVPVVDLTRLVTGEPARSRLNTRLVLVEYPGDNGATHVLGLIAERATETMRRDAGDFLESGVTNARAPYLGPVAWDTHGMVQRIDVEKLLPVDLRDALFRRQLEC